MRLAQLAAALFALPALVWADAESAADKFASLAAANGGVVKLDSKLFRELTASNREWSASIQLTALGASFKCAPCKEFDPTFKAAGKAWSKASAAHRKEHFFASIDFENGQDVFRDLGLQSAPVLLTYTPMKGPRAAAIPRSEPVTYNFQENGFKVDELVEDLSHFTPVPIPYSKPLPYALIFTVAVSVVSLVLLAPYLLPVLTSRWTWAAVTIYTILIMVGGQMFVRIRNSPYAYPGRNGGVSWIVGGYQNQLGAEVHVVAAVYGLLAFTVVALNSIVTRVASPTKQRTGVLLWSAVLMVGFSGLIALFRVKSPSYPFKLFF
ncbi:dolichyl-diphosphooligosaccharide-protein glycotransferase [Exidia glandulosa HHB12029]|uniref:Dolichyl-diphosphooligosaccharide-protein glycotransferase n=1 Tax=Exidia glandulosa HHB12029 TaxID=1314781 RepID=A0A165ZBD4_EXIGL|nr:dolichyl-diphosphooligosaccharide-protein glycotransferase [Exidia glandulosa HHB12029]